MITRSELAPAQLERLERAAEQVASIVQMIKREELAALEQVRGRYAFRRAVVLHNALENGLTKTDLARALGVSRRRVDQILG